jgi:hypothetical protein
LLDGHVLDCADLIDRLTKDGWALKHFGDRTLAQHEDIQTEKQAIMRAKALGIDPEVVTIYSTWNDWFQDVILEAT